ncbi:MAG: MFS transporter [Thermoplasmatales archaeon]|nr:MFS transporter [Thermoplasmatales archaeon]MCK5636216.1 MFS transporter [Thermoplasmatales archaeon]
MIDFAKHRLLKYPLFGSLYFSQGIIYALIVVVINVYFDNKGIPDSITAAIIGLAYLPWIIKFLFGGIVDHYIKFGRRKFIIFGGSLSAVSFIALSLVDPLTALIPFTIILVIGSSGVAFLDVAADAWAIETTVERERGKVNAAMFGGMFIGMAVASIVFGHIAENYSYSLTFVASGLLILAIILFPIMVKETTILKRKQKIIKVVVSEFKKKNTQIITLLFPLSAISFGMLSIIIPQYMNDELLLKIGQIGLVVAIGPIATVVGNITGGFMADNWGRKKSLFVFFGLNLIFCILLIFADSWQRLAIIWGIIGFLHGGHHSALGALAMDVTNPKVGAAQFSLIMAAGNAGEMGGTAVSGSLISIIGFSRIFLYSGWFYGPALLVLYFVRLKSTSKQNHKRS